MKAFIFNKTNITELNKLFDEGYKVYTTNEIGGSQILFILFKPKD